MARILKKVFSSSDGKKETPPPKKEEPKIKKVSEEVFAFIFRKLDTISLTKAVTVTKQVNRKVTAGADVNEDDSILSSLKTILKRMENVLRTGQEAKRDLVGLADDPANGVARADKVAVKQRLRDFQDSRDALLEWGNKMIKRVKNAADELDADMKKQIDKFKQKAKKMDKMFDEYGSLVGGVLDNVASAAITATDIANIARPFGG
jgi:hypothetical protein